MGLFYGWVVVIMAGLACICSFPGNTFGISFFVPHLRKELDLSHVQIACVWGAGVFVVALILPFVGKIIDQHGPWKSIAATTIPLALATMTMSWVQTWWQLLILIALMRFFGVGLIYVSAVRATNHWFKKKRGRVSVLLIIFFYSTMALPSIISYLITSNGWRPTYRIVAAAVVIGMGICLLFIRDDPLKYGLLPDGEVACQVEEEIRQATDVKDVEMVTEGVEEKEGTLEATEAATTTATTTSTSNKLVVIDELGYGIKQATKTLIFWILGTNIFVVELYWCACQFNMLFLLGPESSRAKLKESEVVIIMVILSIVSGCGSVFCGFMIELIQKQRKNHGTPHRKGIMIMVSLQMFMTMASAIVVVHIRSMSMAVLWAILFSFMIGIQDVIMLVAFAEIFGKEKIGELMGLVTSIMTLGTVFGPVLGAIVMSSGELELCFYPMAGVAGLLGIGCLFVKDPV